jgi:hypothetical protein
MSLTCENSPRWGVGRAAMAKQLGAADLTLLPGISAGLPRVRGTHGLTRPASSDLKTASKPVLKNPLRASTMPLLAPAAALSGESGGSGGGTGQPAAEVSAQQLRQLQISEFSAWLRTQTNKHKRPFQEETIRGYAETARALDALLTDLAWPGSQASRCQRLGRERDPKGSLPITHKWMINFIYA